MTSLAPDYESKTAAEKLGLLWDAVCSDPYGDDDLPTKVPVLERRKLLSVEHLRGSFDHVSDELPAGRTKLIHRYGSCAKVTLRWTEEHPFTGVFATGGRALLRFSDGAGVGPVFLGAALKFFLDGRDSLNTFASPQQLGKPPRGFLSTILANNIPDAPDPASKLLASRFEKTAKTLGGTRLHFNYLPLHHLAGTNLDGTEVADPSVPDRMELHATDEALDVVGKKGDFRRRLASLGAGLVLYRVHLSPAIDQPATPVGELVLDSSFVASRYGDERLFFRHDVGPTR
jgi:hypothetical protein